MASALPKTFLITGVSSGLGRAFAAGALEAGHQVIGTVRQAKDAEAFAALNPVGAHPVILDVTRFEEIAAVVAKAEEDFGPVDVLVNNAGYGHEGALEGSSMDDLQRQFAANVFGPVAMIKAILPGMRARRNGHIVNVTSMGGFITMPGISFYCGSKFALEGISEALGKEVAGFGIRVTALAPGSSGPIGPDGRWTARRAAFRTMMPSSIRSVPPAWPRAGTSRAIPPEPLRLACPDRRAGPASAVVPRFRCAGAGRSQTRCDASRDRGLERAFSAVHRFRVRRIGRHFSPSS